MAFGFKILSAVMSLLIVSISEITPWVFANEDATEHSVILDAACFDAVNSIPASTLMAIETVSAETETSSAEIEEPVTEILAEETTFVFEEAVTQIEPATEIATESATEIVSEETTVQETKPTPNETTTETVGEATQAKKESQASLGSNKMLWPVASNSKVVSGFPYYESGGVHHGVDIFVIGADGQTRDGNGNSLSYGKAFRAAKSGVVVQVKNNGEWNTGFGNYCIIDHGDGTQTLYAHAKTIYVECGDKVALGETIGEIGDTGNTTAPHLHFEVRLGDENSYTRVDPLNYISEP